MMHCGVVSCTLISEAEIVCSTIIILPPCSVAKTDSCHLGAVLVHGADIDCA